MPFKVSGENKNNYYFIKDFVHIKYIFSKFITEDYQDKGMLKQLLMDAQVPHHKVYVIVCQSEIR